MCAPSIGWIAELGWPSELGGSVQSCCFCAGRKLGQANPKLHTSTIAMEVYLCWMRSQGFDLLAGSARAAWEVEITGWECAAAVHSSADASGVHLLGLLSGCDVCLTSAQAHVPQLRDGSACVFPLVCWRKGVHSRAVVGELCSIVYPAIVSGCLS